MKYKVHFIVIFSLAIILCYYCTRKDDFLVLKGPYLGQTPPGAEPQPFLPGIITTNDFEGCIAFLDDAKVCAFFSAGRGVLYTYIKNGRWTKPVQASFHNEGGFTDFTAAQDDRTIVFQSNRPTSQNDTLRDPNIWKVEWTGSGWTDPTALGQPPNSDKLYELYPSIGPDGSVYFFTWPGNRLRLGDMLISRYAKGKYQEIEYFEYPINSVYHEVDPVISPDGSYILFGSARPGGYKFFDLYICFKKDDGGWTHPFNTGKMINSIMVPIRMSITPDGKYLFFVSKVPSNISKGELINSPVVQRSGDYDIYWVSTQFINDLKEKFIDTRCASEDIDKEYTNNGLTAATSKMINLFKNERSNYHFEISELLILCARMIESGNDDEAEQFYKALSETIPEELLIKKGYAQINISHGKVNKGLVLLTELWDEYPLSKVEDHFEILSYYLQATSQKEAELELLKFLVKEFPDSYNTYYNLARAYSGIGDIVSAIGYCQKSLGLEPDFIDALDLLKKLEQEQ